MRGNCDTHKLSAPTFDTFKWMSEEELRGSLRGSEASWRNESSSRVRVRFIPHAFIPHLFNHMLGLCCRGVYFCELKSCLSLSFSHTTYNNAPRRRRRLWMFLVSKKKILCSISEATRHRKKWAVTSCNSVARETTSSCDINLLRGAPGLNSSNFSQLKVFKVVYDFSWVEDCDSRDSTLWVDIFFRHLNTLNVHQQEIKRQTLLSSLQLIVISIRFGSSWMVENNSRIANKIDWWYFYLLQIPKFPRLSWILKRGGGKKKSSSGGGSEKR